MRIMRTAVAAGAAIVLGPATFAEPVTESRFRPVPGQVERERAKVRPPVAGLPHARGRTFETLDAYLAFRRELGAVDLPWYKEVAPDMFELQTSIRPAPAPRRFTRAQLARQFGFAD